MLYNMYFDVAALMLDVVLIMLSCFRKAHQSIKAVTFRTMLIVHLGAIIFDIISVYTISFPERYSLAYCYAISIFYYLFHNYSAFLYIMYGLATDKKRANSPRRRTVFMVILAIVFTLIITTPFTKLVFYYDESLVYTHGPLVYLLYALALLSVIYVLVLKLTNKQEQSTFQIVCNVGYVIVLFSAFTYHIFNPEVLIELFAIDLGYLVIYVSQDNPELFLYKTISVFNKRAFDEKLFGIAHRKSHFDVLVFTPKTSEQLKRDNDRPQLFALEKVLIKKLTGEKCFSKNLYVISELCYAVICEHGEAENHVELINSLFKSRLEVEDRTCLINMTYGIFRYPADTNDYNEALLLLDDLSYRLTNNMTNKIIEVDKSSLLKSNEKEMETVLARAIKNNNVLVKYEPIFANGDEFTINAEAKVNIVDNGNEIYLSKDFISLAEKDGLIVDLDEIVLQKVCELINKSNIVNYGIDNIVINLSPAHLKSINFPNKLQQLIIKYHLPTEKICFEIKDLVLGDDSQVVENNMRRIKDLGFKFILDDFGNSTINIPSLISAPITAIKISKSIITNAPYDNRTMKVLINLTKMIRDIGIGIACDGIIGEKQLEVAQEVGFDYMQGSYLGEPLTEDKYLDFYKQQLDRIMSSANDK